MKSKLSKLSKNVLFVLLVGSVGGVHRGVCGGFSPASGADLTVQLSMYTGHVRVR